MAIPTATLQFLGATETVTGSRYLITAGGRRVLVDCGLYQGLKKFRLRNWDRFPVDPATIDAVVVTHAHIDHSGYLPALVKRGFRGAIIASPDTTRLCRVLLPDAAHLQEEEARYANRKGYSKHKPALPLYTRDDAMQALELFTPIEIGEATELWPGFSVEFQWAGHILGAASALITVDSGEHSRRVFFTGDVGRPEHPLLQPPQAPPGCDYLVTESTYGDRTHADEASEMDRLAEAINGASTRGGMVLMPAFAVDRTEVVLHAIRTLEHQKRIPSLPIFVDSPMALDVLRLYRAAQKRDGYFRHDQDLTDALDTSRITECRTVEESMALAALTYPSIIISASGMATGGRVLHHLRRLLPSNRNAVVLCGFQAAGTRGRHLADGTRTLKMFGQYVAVRAHVDTIESFSVHADGDELVKWLGQVPDYPTTCFVTHGSPPAANALRDRLDDELGWTAVVPRYLEQVTL